MVLRASILSQMAAPIPSMLPMGEPRRVAEDASVSWRLGAAGVCGSGVDC